MMVDDLEDEQTDLKVDKLILSVRKKVCFRSIFANYKSRILKEKSATSVGSFFNTKK
jgi:hypothetical protein